MSSRKVKVISFGLSPGSWWFDFDVIHDYFLFSVRL